MIWNTQTLAERTEFVSVPTLSNTVLAHYRNAVITICKAC